MRVSSGSLEWGMPRWFIRAAMSAAALAFWGASAPAQTAPTARMTPVPAQTPAQAGTATNAPSELQTGAELTREGYLAQAIPHLLAARQAGLDSYTVGVNLGICYLGTDRYREAISDLQGLNSSGLGSATVENLLSQAYIATGQTEAAYRTFLRAAALSPKNEKTYDYLADACTDHQNYELGLEIVNRGLAQLPGSARLHYEKAVFLSELGSFGEGKPEFDRAAQLAPGSYIGYLAQVQKFLYEGDLPDADKTLHQAIQAGHRDYRMLSLLGTVLLHEGVIPGEPRFAEAQAALEESAREQPDYPSTQIALGKIYLMQGNAKQAVAHLETGRRLEPENAGVYASLADAYEMLGQRAKSRAMRQELGRLLAEKQRKPSPGSGSPPP
jgi:tetratricopeptide (TPR) repeat protein